VFRRWNYVLKLFHVIQIAVVVLFKNFAVHEAIQIGKIANHSSIRSRRSAYRHLENVIMSMPERIVALAVNPAVLFLAHGFVMEAMRCREFVPTGEICPHSSPYTSAKRSAFSYTRTR